MPIHCNGVIHYNGLKYFCFYIGISPLPNAKFMTAERIIPLLMQDNATVLPSIPAIVKENVFMIVDNKENMERRVNGRQSVIFDNCGAWTGVSGGATPCTTFIMSTGRPEHVIAKNGVYYKEKHVAKNKKIFMKLHPQPQLDDVINLHRHYSSLKADRQYKRRVSFLTCPGNQTLAKVCVIEYCGKYVKPIAHGNSKTGDALYVRTAPATLRKISAMNSQPPRQIYEELGCDESDMPRDSKQIRNQKYRDKQKIKGQGNAKNFADNVESVIDMVQEHPFVQGVEHSKSTVPTIILYTTEVMEQMKMACAVPKPAVIGVDRTFNLGDMFVTVMVFKQSALIRKERGESPIFIGPVFLHGEATQSTYCKFFTHIAERMRSSGCCMQNFIFGSDDEKAMTSALKYAFPEATHLLCTRHLMGNVKDYLINKVGVPESLRRELMSKLFGDNGVVSADDSVVFDERMADVLQICNNKDAALFVKYIDKRLKSALLEHVMKPRWDRQVQESWTNNNTESANHVLKCAIDWKPQPVVQLVEKLYGVIQTQQRDLRRSLTATGNYKLAPDRAKFYVEPQAWAGMSAQAKKEAVNAMLKGKNQKLCTATDGKLTVVKPSGSKKPGQRTRPRANRTASTPKRKRTE